MMYKKLLTLALSVSIVVPLYSAHAAPKTYPLAANDMVFSKTLASGAKTSCLDRHQVYKAIRLAKRNRFIYESAYVSNRISVLRKKLRKHGIKPSVKKSILKQISDLKASLAERTKVCQAGPDAVIGGACHTANLNKPPTELTGEIYGDQIWTGHIRISSWITIKSHVKIMPCTVVETVGTGIVVRTPGRIEALGEPGKEVIFTSASSEKAPRQWQGFDFGSQTGVNTLKNTIIEAAGAYDRYAISTDNDASISIDQLTIRNSFRGLELDERTIVQSLSGVTFDSIQDKLIFAYGGAGLAELNGMNLLNGNPQNKFALDLRLSRDLRLRNLGVPYLLVGQWSNAGELAGVTLSVDAGVQLLTEPAKYYRIHSGGNLRFLGTPSSRIVVRPDSENPLFGLWNGIYFSSDAGPANELRYVDIRQAGSTNSYPIGIGPRDTVHLTTQGVVISGRSANLSCDLDAGKYSEQVTDAGENQYQVCPAS